MHFPHSAKYAKRVEKSMSGWQKMYWILWCILMFLFWSGVKANKKNIRGGH